MALDTTVGGSNSDSYITVAEADTFASNEYDDGGWASLDTATKEKLLKRAAQDLELLSYKGSKYYTGIEGASDYQKLSFPRSYNIDANGNVIIPSEVKLAQWRQARHILKFSKELEERTVLSHVVDSYTIGGVRELNLPTLNEKLKKNQIQIAPDIKIILRDHIIKSPRIYRA